MQIHQMMVLLYTVRENLTCNQAFLYFFISLFAGKQAILVIVDSVDQNELLIADEHFASYRYQPAFILANGRNRLSYQPEKQSEPDKLYIL